jgi:hypothetical protein
MRLRDDLSFLSIHSFYVIERKNKINQSIYSYESSALMINIECFFQGGLLNVTMDQFQSLFFGFLGFFEIHYCTYSANIDDE